MNIDQLHDNNYIPFIQRESQFDFISLGIEPIFTVKFEQDIDLENIPSDKRRTARISTHTGRIKKMAAVKTNGPFNNEYDDIKVTRVVPKESKTIETGKLNEIENEKGTWFDWQSI